MSSTAALNFTDPGLIMALHTATDATLDTLDFGVIGMDSLGLVRRYNRFESEAAGLSRERVVGQPLFTVVAPCMNNFMIAQRFEDAQHQCRHAFPHRHLDLWQAIPNRQLADQLTQRRQQHRLDARPTVR